MYPVPLQTRLSWCSHIRQEKSYKIFQPKKHLVLPTYIPARPSSLNHTTTSSQHPQIRGGIGLKLNDLHPAFSETIHLDLRYLLYCTGYCINLTRLI